VSTALLNSYRVDPERYDELVGADGALRPHWRGLIDRIDNVGADGARRGVELARRLIIENGVTYNVYADAQGRDRPWALDPMPLVISASEWATIETGIAQRARLLDALLADLYGPQKLLREGLVPTEIVYGHPNFLWPCVGSLPQGARHLHIYAADLARAADGKWWVLGDRTQTPSGPGYALENRRIVSRVFGDALYDLGVRPLSGYFAGLREQLHASAEEDEEPLAIVLTPGPYNETYFEHAYLARQLGMPLVEGQDLTVRGDTLYLKTLGGLKRVHAVLRRLDDDFCDPAELRADSALGVPGLLKVVRANRVVMANSLGSGVLESAAWLGFLPPAAPWLIDETLSLPSVATWWCGERPALEHVIENLDRVIIKSAFPNQRFEPTFGRDLNEDSRDELIRRLRLRPYAYVAQERVALSQTPSWRASGLTGRAVAIRVYAIATPDGYQVMSGGLARVGSETYADVVSNQRGGGSKDIWVLTNNGENQPNAEPASPPRMRTRSEDLPSRAAENLFWLGRYCERSESKARLVRATLNIERGTPSWPHAVATCREFGAVAPDASVHNSIYDQRNSLGFGADLKRVDWSATQMRGRLSSEQWRALVSLQHDYAQHCADRTDAREALDQLLLALNAFSGLALDDMIQDDGWRLMMLGRRVERAHFLSLLIASSLRDGAEPTRSELEWLLDVTGSTIAYRTRHTDRARLAPVMALIVSDKANPRSIKFQHTEIVALVEQLATTFSGIALEDQFVHAVLDVVEADFGRLDGQGTAASAARKEFSEQLLSVGNALLSFSDRLSLKHFSHIDDQMHVVAA
jgi:uncharacterized circularly permuted ATP-grasp superfamily protein/uncharacterized alpha-E superfamily protein